MIPDEDQIVAETGAGFRDAADTFERDLYIALSVVVASAAVAGVIVGALLVWRFG